MSLDVYLTLEVAASGTAGSGIFVREDGSVREVTRAEWDAAFPGREPVVLRAADEDEDGSEVFHRNITHNVSDMADAAGLYDCMWRPEQHGIETAQQLIEPLKAGLALLQQQPARFEAMNPPNGWGSYDGLVSFVSAYLQAATQYPTAKVRASR
jgi:hypothetical protein